MSQMLQNSTCSIDEITPFFRFSSEKLVPQLFPCESLASKYSPLFHYSADFLSSCVTRTKRKTITTPVEG
jgi:hypothetical protein